MLRKVVAAIGFVPLIVGCGGACCNAPAFHAGAAPTPTPTPVPTPTASPAPSLACSQGGSAIALGPALAPFAVLAGSTITNVGNSLVSYGPGAATGTVHDDLIGVWPGTAITGFYPPGTDTDGTNAIYAAGYNTDTAVPMAAQGALTTAYNTAAGRAATALVAGDLSQASVPGYPTGTLPPGVYKSTSTLGIMAGNLTLDGLGNPQSVFIFQMVDSLTTTFNGGAGGNVLLTNGANACNIYWQAGSSATLGGARSPVTCSPIRQSPSTPLRSPAGRWQAVARSEMVPSASRSRADR